MRELIPHGHECIRLGTILATGKGTTVVNQMAAIRRTVLDRSGTAGLRIPEDIGQLNGPVVEVGGVHLIEVGMGHVASELVVRAEHINARGGIQGGLVAVIADATAGWATSIIAGVDAFATSDLKGNLLRGVGIGEVLTGVATVLHHGRRTVVVSTDVTSAGPAGALVARFLITQIVLSSPSTGGVS